VDHTADIGVEVEGESLPDLFAAAGAALAELLYDPATVEAGQVRETSVTGAGSEALMVRWLNELIVIWETESFLWRSVEVEMAGEAELRARLEGEPFDPARHAARGGIKAATYHQLRVDRIGSGWRGRVIFDV
jgi:SHS2 domain-containing protein